MKKILFWMIPLMSFGLFGSAYAQPGKPLPIDIAIVGGMNVPSFSTDDQGADIQNKMGWQVGVLTSIKVHGILNIEPQLMYQHQGFRLRTGEESRHIRSNTLQLPITLSVGLGRVVRLYTGPVFTLLDRSRQKSGGDLLDFDRVHSTVGYTLGIRLHPLRHLLFDVRYNGQFSDRDHIKQRNEEVVNNLKHFNVGISVGYLF